MGKFSKGKKIVIGLVVGVLATTAIVCATVPQVRESIKDLISKIKGEQTPEEKEKQDKEKAQEKTHDDDYYQDLTDDEKEDFDKKLDELVDSDHYKNLDDVIVAYNAGETTMMNWKKNNQSIQYAETRHYLKRVKRNITFYQRKKSLFV